MRSFPRTLLVDDDPATNFLHRKLLEKMGMSEHIAVALNGQEALDLLAAEDAAPGAPATLVLLDVNMPVMNGFEFMEAYQRLPLARQQSLVVVLLTTSLHPQDLRRAALLPVAGLLSKPLTRESVEQLLETRFNA